MTTLRNKMEHLCRSMYLELYTSQSKLATFSERFVSEIVLLDIKLVQRSVIVVSAVYPLFLVNLSQGVSKAILPASAAPARGAPSTVDFT